MHAARTVHAGVRFAVSVRLVLGYGATAAIQGPPGPRTDGHTRTARAHHTQHATSDTTRVLQAYLLLRFLRDALRS